MKTEILFGGLILLLSLSAFAIATFGEDQLPAQVKTEDHRQWVLEQCTRSNLDEQTKQSCKNFFEE